jgi:hypothetical protein
MKNKKLSKTNLQFFTDNSCSLLENQLQELATYVEKGKMPIKTALAILEKATCDTHLIFWHITHEIGRCRVYIRNVGNEAPILHEHYNLDVSSELDYSYTEEDSTVNDDMAALRVQSRIQL